MSWTVELHREEADGGIATFMFPSRPVITAGEGWVRVADTLPGTTEGSVGEVWLPSKGISKVRVAPDTQSQNSGI